MNMDEFISLLSSVAVGCSFGWLIGTFLVGPAVAIAFDKHTLIPILNEIFYGRIIFNDYMEYIYFPLTNYILLNTGLTKTATTFGMWKNGMFNVYTEDFYLKYIQYDLKFILPYYRYVDFDYHLYNYSLNELNRHYINHFYYVYFKKPFINVVMPPELIMTPEFINFVQTYSILPNMDYFVL